MVQLIPRYARCRFNLSRKDVALGVHGPVKSLPDERQKIFRSLMVNLGDILCHFFLNAIPMPFGLVVHPSKNKLDGAPQMLIV